MGGVPIVILHIRAPQFLGSLNKEGFSLKNVSELKSSVGNPFTDHINYFVEDGEQRAQGPEEVTELPKLLLKITEPMVFHSWILPRLKQNSLAPPANYLQVELLDAEVTDNL